MTGLSQPTPPDTDEYWNALGIQHALAGRTADAIAAFEESIKLNPNSPGAYINLGHAQMAEGHWDDAIDSYREATSFPPPIAAAFCYLGNALRNNGRTEAAIDAYRQCLNLQPNHEEAALALGRALRAQGEPHQAVEVYRKSIAASPAFALVHVNLGHTLLTLGEFREGWIETAWQSKMVDPAKCVSLPQPYWDGSDLAGKRILLYTEQGFGDAIMFIRYAPLVAQRGGRVLVGCFNELLRLFQTIEGVDQFVGDGQPLPQFDVHCSLHGLPRILDTQLENIPARIPYLRADGPASARWRNRMKEFGNDLKIGLVWAGASGNGNDERRSLSLSQLAPLAAVPGVRFISLQKEAPATRAHDLKLPIQLIDWTSELTDFADTAALIDNLDLVIGVDTAVTHLAGAMGKPVWVLTFTPPEWRWLIDRPDSPWYPTMRLFRQPRPGDWASAVDELSRALADLAAGRRRE